MKKQPLAWREFRFRFRLF